MSAQLLRHMYETRGAADKRQEAYSKLLVSLGFAPMAMASFEMLGAELDLDARYDYGRVATETGNLDVAVAQADTILRSSPTHLLGLSLAARAADKQGNAALAAKTWKAFMAAKDAELKKNLTEYQAHAADIESATAMAKGGK